MEFTLRNGSLYRSVIFKLSAYSVLSVLGCILLGYIFLPFATAAYAALLTFESRGKRVMSYAIPAVLVTLNFLIRAAFSLEAITYIVLGVILYFAAKKGWSKSETAVWMMIVALLLLFCSAILIAFEKTGTVGVFSIRQFYSNIYLNTKEYIIDYLTSLTTVNVDGVPIFVFDLYDAECIFNELLLSLVPMSIIISFGLVGFSFKLFESALRKNAIEETALSEWRFGASNLTCYFYIVVAVLSLIAENDGSIFIYTLITLNTVFSVIFAYLGFRFVYNLLLSKGRSSLFAITLLVLAFIMFSSAALTILSFLGVTVALIFNRSSQASK